MNKRAFLERLRARLRGLPRREVEERLNFYIEMIDDRIEEGLSEEAAIDAVGDVDEIAEQIRAGITGKDALPRPEPKKWRAWEIVLIVLGSPLWITLLAAALCLVLAVFIVIWSVNLVLWVLALPFYLFSYAAKYVTRWSVSLTKITCSQVKKFFSGR